jgi:hypothetical protein
MPSEETGLSATRPIDCAGAPDMWVASIIPGVRIGRFTVLPPAA